MTNVLRSSPTWTGERTDNSIYRDILFTLHPFIRSTIQDKILGVMFGSALGDAIGLYTGVFSQDRAITIVLVGNLNHKYT
jgi:hypothetical protein